MYCISTMCNTCAIQIQLHLLCNVHRSLSRSGQNDHPYIARMHPAARARCRWRERTCLFCSASWWWTSTVGSKTPCLAMTSERERDKSVFGVASMPGLSGFRDNETGQARANVVTPPPILAQLATRILRYGDGGARAHVQRCPTPPMTCGKHLLNDLQPTYQIWTQSVKPFLRYRSAACTCARADVQIYPTHELF